jgi:hypothetical protein
MLENKNFIFERVSKTGHVKLADRPTGPPPMHFRGDSIIPVMFEGNFKNTDQLRHNGIVLYVFPGKERTASGDLFWDDGESINTIESGKYNYYTFKLHSNCSLEIDVIKSGYDMISSPLIIKSLLIHSDTIEGDIEASLNGNPVKKVGELSPLHDKVGTIFYPELNLQSLKAGDKWVISWRLTKTNSCNIK